MSVRRPPDPDPLPAAARVRATVEAARLVFRSAAASVLLTDEAAGELVFAAVSGRGAEDLVGRRIPAGRGIAGWVVACAQPIIVDDTAGAGQFARDIAESTGFVPTSIAAYPLVTEDGCHGVLEVLDRDAAGYSDVEVLGLMAYFSRHAAEATCGRPQSRPPGAARLDDTDPQLASMFESLAESVYALGPDARELMYHLLAVCGELMAVRGGRGLAAGRQ